MNSARTNSEVQANISRPTKGISLSDAAKISSHNEGKLRRLVKSGQLRATIIVPPLRPDPARPKHAQGREVLIWVDPADVLALEPSAAPKTKKVRSATAPEVKGGGDVPRH